MAPTQARVLQEKVAALADTAAALQFRISREERATCLVDGMLASLKEQVEDFPSKPELPASARAELDAVATALWNACVHMNTPSLNDKELNARSEVRAVACSLINLAASTKASGHIRALKVAFIASRLCIENEQQDLALAMLKAAAQRLDSLQSLSPPNDPVQTDTIAAEYYVLRAHLARLQGRLDIADHLYSKIPPTGILDRQHAVVELCYIIGNDAFVACQYETATKWLEKAVVQLDARTADQSQEKCFKDLDLCVRSTLVRAYLKTGAPAETEKPKEQLDILKREHGNMEGVLLLEISLIRCEENPDANAFFRVLNGIIECMSFTESTFDLILQNINWSKRLSIGLGMEALLSLTQRVPVDTGDSIEKCFIRAVAMAACMALESQLPDQTCIDFIKRTIQSMEARRFNSLSREAAHAALILIWRQVDNAFCQGRSYIAEKWCHLVLDAKIFENISSTNRLKIIKKANVEMTLNSCQLALHEAKLGLEEKPSVFSLEFEWLCIKSFNIARQLLSRDDTKASKRLLSSMRELVSVYEETPKADLIILVLQDFLEMIMHITDARSSAKHMDKGGAYLNVLNRSIGVKHYLMYFPPPHRSPLDDILQAILGINSKESLMIALAMQLEAGLFLHRWPMISDWLFELIHPMRTLPDSMTEALWAKAMHLFLSSENIPRDLKVYCIAYIIQNLYRRTELTTSLRVACPRYLRVLFDLCIADTFLLKPLPRSSPLVQYCDCRGKFERGQEYLILAEWVLDQAIKTAGDEAHMNSEAHREQHRLWKKTHADDAHPFCEPCLYPPDELEYLARSSFNQAAELYAHARDEDFRRWAKKSIQLAELMDSEEGKMLGKMLWKRMDVLRKYSTTDSNMSCAWDPRR